MITILKEVHIDSKKPCISLQGVAEGDYDVVVVQPRKKSKRRQAGFSRAKFNMSSDFNAPLDDFKEYM